MHTAYNLPLSLESLLVGPRRRREGRGAVMHNAYTCPSRTPFMPHDERTCLLSTNRQRGLTLRMMSS